MAKESQELANKMWIDKIEVLILGFKEEVVDGVEEDVAGSGGCRQEAGPLPPVIFRVEQEVSANDSDANGNYNENQDDEEHETVNVIDLVSPERSEDEIPVFKKIYKELLSSF